MGTGWGRRDSLGAVVELVLVVVRVGVVQLVPGTGPSTGPSTGGRERGRSRAGYWGGVGWLRLDRRDCLGLTTRIGQTIGSQAPISHSTATALSQHSHGTVTAQSGQTIGLQAPISIR